MMNERERPPAEAGAARDAFESAMLTGDAARAKALLQGVDVRLAATWRDGVLSELTADCLDGRVPFCQLTAAAQVACLLNDGRAPAVACCGAIAGNTSATGRDFTLMLLSAWGVPVMDLGVDVPEAAFLDAVVEHDLRFVICSAFSQADLAPITRLDRLARERGIRERFSLLVSGAQTERDDRPAIPWDCPDHRAAAVAEWVVRAWRA